MGLSLGLAVALWGCPPAAQRAGTTATDTTAGTAVAGDSRALARNTAPAISPPISEPPAGADAGSARPVAAPRPSEVEQSPTIREILASSALVGRRVHVTGRCLGYGRAVAVGRPPRTRSDWQLEAEGVAIYVTGPLPAGCSATEGSNQPTTILAHVAEDTLPARGDRAAAARRYLVRVVR